MSDIIEESKSGESGNSVLYKFLADNAPGDRHYETLKADNIYAASFRNLNDRWDVPSKFFVSDFVQKLPNPFARELAERLQVELNSLGVYCLSGRKESALMWAHYANNWKGLCVEYGNCDRRTFFSELRDVHGASVLVGALDMHYVDSPTRLDASELSTVHDMRLLVRKILGQKEKDWSYEREFRIIFSRPGLYHMPRTMLSGVYLGYEMEDAQKQKYATLLSSRGIPVWEARPGPNEFNELLTSRLS